MKSDTLNKERIKALGEILLAECRSRGCSTQTVEAILDGGAPVDYKNSSSIKAAAKNLNFELIKFLMDKGAELNDLSISYIASACDNKGYNDETEARFFETLDLVKEKAGGGMRLYAPYINSMAVSGRLDKLEALMKKYSLTGKETAGAVHTRIIFEIINNGHDNVLNFIERHRDWIDTRIIDLCASCDEWMVLEHILERTSVFPSDTAVAEAIYLYSFMTLNVLDRAGYDFSGRSLFLEKARRAAAAGRPEGLDFLLRRGYSPAPVINAKIG